MKKLNMSSTLSQKETVISVNQGMRLKRNTWWIREESNPVLPPMPGSSFDQKCCMNPNIQRLGDRYHLYYAGADENGCRRICLATAKVGDLENWDRHGPVIDIGHPGDFDAKWTVLPHVVRVGDKWHLYYTGNSGTGNSLGMFKGLGLAISEDGVHFEKHSGGPIIQPSGIDGDPDTHGIAGGSVIEARLPDGSREWRYYYTGCPTLGDDVFIDQQKTCCLATSRDGIHFEKRGAVLERDPDRATCDIAVAGPVVHQLEDGSYQMYHSAIGTRWGYYSIGYAESADGLSWHRGPHEGDELMLGPNSKGWDAMMVEYPTVIDEGGRRRLFYCGSQYGSTGIGTAVACPLRISVDTDELNLHVAADDGSAAWSLLFPRRLWSSGEKYTVKELSRRGWIGPDQQGMFWREEGYALDASDVQIRMRWTLKHTKKGIRLKCTLFNATQKDIRALVVDFVLDRHEEKGDQPLAWSSDGDGFQAVAEASRLRCDLRPGETRSLEADLSF